jgi:hypothetical protein
VDREDPDEDLSVIRALNPDIAIAPSLLATSDRLNERIGALPSSPLLRVNLPRRLFGWMASN